MDDKKNIADWEVIPLDEQETILEINYDEKQVRLYTSRKAVAKRLFKRLGEPEVITTTNNGLVNSVTYVRDLHDKNIKPIFTMGCLVGNYRRQKD